MPLSTDLTFLTNESGNSLLDRFNVLLAKDTRLFDCLVGYFFISGFHKLYPSLEKVEKIRILVGLNTDRKAYELIQDAKAQEELNFTSHASAKDQVVKELAAELENSPDSADIETGVHKFVEWLRSAPPKLEIKAYPSGDLHAKVYIMTFAEGDRDMGRVITGSSNLTESGLQRNLEFNVELKNRADYDFAIAKFNELWAVAVDVSKPYEDIIENQSSFAQFTPLELYLKFLYEYFRRELNQPAELQDIYLPTGFKRLKYQEEAVLSAKRVLEEYGGVFLSDVVGLGKTYMAALLAQQLDGRSLVIAPPHLLDAHNPGSWRNVFGDFGVRQTDFESIGKLDDLLLRDVSKYSNVFIDESHRFRTESTESYESLAQICRGKRVILVAFDQSSAFCNDKGFIIASEDFFLLAVLNSSLFWEYVKGVCSPLQGGFYEMRRISIEPFPIPDASLAARAVIAALAQKCLDAQGVNCQAWEHEIDARVAALYGIDPADLDPP